MYILLVAFVGILLIIFGAAAFVLRPTSEQKAVARRIEVIKASGEETYVGGNELDKLLKSTQNTRFGWLENLVHSYHFAQKMRLLILQADRKTTIGSVMFASLGLACAGFVICYLFFPVLAVAATLALILAYAPFGVLFLRRSRRIAAFDTALPDAIDMMARALRAGHSVASSISMIAEQAVEPAKSEFAEVFRKQNYGLPLRDALMELLDRVPSQDLRVFVTGILVQKDTGGNLAEILDRIVHVIRERLRIRGEIRTHTAQGRLTGWILCALPIVMLVLINVINPGYSKVLLDDPLGRKLLYVGVGLLCLGGFLINQIINGIEV